MLRKKILRKIYFTTLIVFILFVVSSFTMNKNIANIQVEYQTNLSHIYLLDDENYLLEVSIMVKDDLMENVRLVLNNLKAGNNHFSGFKGLIPKNTKIQDIKLQDGILTIDFDEELLNINQELEEKMIESIVYSLLSFKEINGIKITINGKDLLLLPKSGIVLDDILTKSFGINKEYAITSMNNIQKVVLYYYEEKDRNQYFVPITKYLNSRDDKIKVIIDNLKNDYLAKTNLMSYLNDKVNIAHYEQKDNMVMLSFSNLNYFDSDIISEEVIYTLSSSIMNSIDTKKIIFTLNDHILTIKER